MVLQALRHLQPAKALHYCAAYLFAATARRLSTPAAGSLGNDVEDAAGLEEPKLDTTWFVEEQPNENISNDEDASNAAEPLWMINMRQANTRDILQTEQNNRPSYRSHSASEFQFGPLVTSQDVVHYLQLEQGVDVCALNVADKCDITDTMIIASGRHTNHMRSMAEGLLHKLKQSRMPEGGYTSEHAPAIEGADSDNWMVIDMGSTMMVHLFTEEGRAKYRLDELWRGINAHSMTGVHDMSPEELLTLVEKRAREVREGTWTIEEKALVHHVESE